MSSADITQLLEQARQGAAGAAEQLIPLVYDQLRVVARRHLRHERDGHTLQPTALVNDALMRLLGAQALHWQSRAHFFAVASQAMRRILIDYARQHRADKRGGELRKVSLDNDLAYEWRQAEAVLDMNHALDRLAEYDQRLSRVVEMRFFGGMTEEEIAEVLNVNARTVRRDWNFARTWLYAEMTRR